MANDGHNSFFLNSRRDFLRTMLSTVACSVIAPPAFAGQSTLLTLGPRSGHIVPADYAGLSYEKAQLADPTFFAPDNRQLIEIFQTLNPQGVLRIGGNSSDFCWWKTHATQAPPARPEQAKSSKNWMPHTFIAVEPVAVRQLAGFLESSGWRAIYGLNLGTGTPEQTAEEAAFVAHTLGSRLLFFQIGNEPDFYGASNNQLRAADWDFEKYLSEWLRFARAVVDRVPHARFGGPDVGSSGDWVTRFAAQAPPRLPGHIHTCTGHYYAEGPPDDPSVTIARLLAPDPKIHHNMPRIMAAARQAGLEYRMTEGNSCYRGGKPGMSNAFCSALWSADYLLELAGYGVSGVNLHGGGTSVIQLSLGGHLPGLKLGRQAAAEAAEGSFYTPIAGSRKTGFTARPVFYGMKLAMVLSGGNMRPAHLPVDGASATAYAADFEGEGTRLVILNKDVNEPLSFMLPCRETAKVWRLEAPSLTALAGVTLAGSTFGAKPWKPRQVEHISPGHSGLPLLLTPASAAAVFCKETLT